jgi:hypothetical protein
MLQTVEQKVVERQSHAPAQIVYQHSAIPKRKFEDTTPSVADESMITDLCASDAAVARESPTVADGDCFASAGKDANHTLLHADPEEGPGGLMRLLKRYPLPKEFEEELEDMLDELHCPLPRFCPSAASCQNVRYHNCNEPYSAHAHWIEQEEGSQLTGNSSKKRCIIMGKSLNPIPPSHVSSASRQRLANAHRQRAASCERGDMSDRTCPLCMQVRQASEYGLGTKARYCRACEKLRWEGRKRGLKVNALRAALERYGHLSLSAQELAAYAASDFPASPSLGASNELTAANTSGDDAAYDVSPEIDTEEDNLKKDGIPGVSATPTNGCSMAEDPAIEQIAALLERGAAAIRRPSVCSSSTTQSTVNLSGHAPIDCVGLLFELYISSSEQVCFLERHPHLKLL